jgi:hypothetical protein
MLSIMFLLNKTLFSLKIPDTKVSKDTPTTIESTTTKILYSSKIL